MDKKRRLQWALGTFSVLLLVINGYILWKSPVQRREVIPEQKKPHAIEPAGPEPRSLPHPEAEPPADPRNRASQEEVDQVGEALRKALAAFRINAPAVHKSELTYSASIPRDLNIHRLTFALIDELDKIDGEIRRIVEDRRKGRLEYTIAVDGDWACRIVLMRRESMSAVSGRMAIIVDDFGYANNDLVKKFLFYPKPLTIAILPGQKATSLVARDARLANREMLVHMPMEPRDAKWSDEGYTLLAGQDAGTVRLRVRAALAQLPAALGINNHEGSKVTPDRAMMRTVMAELKRQNKIFIDSRTSPQSVALEAAREAGVRAAANQYFLDAEDDEDFIEAQLNKAAAVAAKQGQVIVICHMRKRTYRVLERMIPALEQQGIRFVYITEAL
ncbi:MAG TPA: divergent polysaccharide deacetylase family protein [bacterium]|nr:divergent polysaccharide deacetylase family protein [bacterium]HQG45093.1 divergent polysaccharide deacetylase family protein [bacterium]HQI47163.1 divergent polysaccharide deacetylase family protein [bacterium]HQJ63538.1 divergent polysaccharide deacetylase family protein [bacterium]